MKTINVKPIEELEIKFTDDESYICSFNMMAMAYIQEEMQKTEYDVANIPPDVVMQILIYSGIKANNKDFTMDLAKALVNALGPGHYTTIMKMYNDAMQSSMDTETKARVKKLTARYLSNAKK